jgi:ribosomal protein S18 acetylase RimI-like enzyme
VRIDDLTRDDLGAIGWSGSSSHLKNVAGQLDRRDRGEVEYLVVREDGGQPVAKGAVDYLEHPGAGSIMQVATRTDLEGRGYAQMIMAEAERRIVARGLHVARLDVEPDNLRARRLYEHLGYQPLGTREIGWEVEHDDGTVGWHSTTVVEMEKHLSR